jgi:hypothetical protein
MTKRQTHRVISHAMNKIAIFFNKIILKILMPILMKIIWYQIKTHLLINRGAEEVIKNLPNLLIMLNLKLIFKNIISNKSDKLYYNRTIQTKRILMNKPQNK